MTYDYLIVGSGLWGSVFAYQMKQAGKKCLVIEKREVIGGNIRCENIDGINCHVHGPHIFHTNDKKIWDFVQQFVQFNSFVYSPIANYQGQLYNLPFNMNTFNRIWGVTTPAQAMARIAEQSGGFHSPANLEEQAIGLVGKDVYRLLIKGYTQKQWGRECSELPASIIKRLPVRFTFDNNYFNDRFQGIPIGGYNRIIEGLLQGIEVWPGCDFFADRPFFSGLATTVVYTGSIDRFFDFRFGQLQYRSLRFETTRIETENYQGVAVVNYTGSEVPYTRSIEHKHFEGTRCQHTVITREFPEEWGPGKEQYYPINDAKNSQIFSMYSDLAERSNVIFGGRLGNYRYYDMHQAIASAMVAAKNELQKESPGIARGSTS